MKKKHLICPECEFERIYNGVITKIDYKCLNCGAEMVNFKNNLTNK